MNAPTYINSTHRALARNPGGLTLEEIAGKIRAKAKKAAEQVRELHDLGMIQTTEEAGQPVYKLDEAAAAVPSQTAWMMAGDSEGGEADAPAADADGWIPWVATADSVCPVPDGTLVRVRLENGNEDVFMAGLLRWHSNRELIIPIVAYKIIAQAPADFATTPELQYLSAEDYADMPPADPALLAAANRALGEQLEAITAERDELSGLNTRLSGLLDAISVAVRGEPAPLSLHSFHDLPDRVTAAINALKGAMELAAESDDLRARLDAAREWERLWEQKMKEATGEDGPDDVAAVVAKLRAELATERQAREALQEQADYFAKYAPSGYLVCATKRKPRRINDGERAKFAALAAVRAGAARAEVLAVVPVGTARRGAEWRAK